MESYQNQSKTVSVALCTYNGERFLEEQLNSIIDQDYQELTEIICVDDNSTDQTFQILELFAKKDNRIKIFKNDTNLGYVKNFEKALKLCTNSYIAISDQDDIWHHNKISILINSIGDSLMVYSDNEYVDETNNSLNKRFSDIRKLGTCRSCLNFALYNSISGHVMLINRNLLNYCLPFRIEIPFDYWLAFHAAQHSEIPFVNEVLVRYRQHSSNVIGALGLKHGKRKSNHKEYEFQLLKLLGSSLDEKLLYEKDVFKVLIDTFLDKSFKSRHQKVKTFIRNRKTLLFFKKKNNLRQIFYCLKLYWS